MKCKVRIKRQSKDIEYEFTGGEKLSDMLLAIGLIPDTVLVFKNDIPVPEDEYLEEDEYLIAETASRG